MINKYNIEFPENQISFSTANRFIRDEKLKQAENTAPIPNTF